MTKAIPVSELPKEVIERLKNTKMDEKYNYLNDELLDSETEQQNNGETK